jgi:hypothetical protein
MGIEDNRVRVGDRIVNGVVILGSSGSIVDFGTTGDVKDGSKNVTTAGTRVALASTTACQGVLIQAKAANTGIIYVGGSTVSSTSGIFLYAGESVEISIDNLSKVYIDSSVSGEGVVFTYGIA